MAMVFHASQGEFADLPFVAALAIIALWPDREIQAASPQDRAALQTFRLYGTAELTHEMHLRVPRLHLMQLPLGAASEKFTSDLKRYAKKKGKPDKFHQTTTVAYLLLIRVARRLRPRLKPSSSCSLESRI